MASDRATSDAVNVLVSERLRELRRSGGRGGRPLTQAAFADLTGVNKATIVNIENRRQGATLAVLYTIAEALSIDIASLLPDVGEVMRARSRDDGSPSVEDELPEWAELVQASTADTAGRKDP